MDQTNEPKKPVTSGTPTPSGRPVDASKHFAILLAAKDEFFEHGVEATAIEKIAAKANVSKVTVYNKFGSKEALFEAVVDLIAQRIEAGFGDMVVGDTPISEALVTYGNQLMMAFVNGQLLGAQPVFLMEAPRHPELAERFFDAAPGRVRKTLADAFDTRIERGEIVLDDSKRAAEDLVGLWQGLLFFEMRLKPKMSVSAEDIDFRVRRGVRLFMKAHDLND